jgi:hypothetical protein
MSSVFAAYKLRVCLALTMNLAAAQSVIAAQQDVATPPALMVAADLGPAQNGASIPPLATAAVTSATVLPPAAPASGRPAPLVPLYISLASLQVLDIDSTMKGLNRGAVEANPLMRGVVGSPPAVIAIKAAVTGVLITSSEKLWKKNRVAAVLLMVGMNGFYAAVVAHNYSVAR